MAVVVGIPLQEPPAAPPGYDIYGTTAGPHREQGQKQIRLPGQYSSASYQEVHQAQPPGYEDYGTKGTI